MLRLIGPFTQLLTMAGLPPSGPLSDEQLCPLSQAGILVKEDKIVEIGSFDALHQRAESIEELPQPLCALPGFIDCHTHICFAGSRAGDFALRCAGLSYQEIAARGGGILDTVRHTREASLDQLVESLCQRLDKMRSWGVTSCEVKSGYGLSFTDELKMLEAISRADQLQSLSLIPTCLAAHTKAPEFNTSGDYLDDILNTLLPEVRRRNLAKRVDIFIEEGAFTQEEGIRYLSAAKHLGFALCVHADQFSTGGSRVAAEVGALSADHLEQSTEKEGAQLKAAGAVAVVLPGASIGLGMAFAPARRLLNLGLPLAIASDWNPGSAPMGNLLAQTGILAAAEKLSMAEALAAITYRAAAALGLADRGHLAVHKRADLALFPTNDYRDILYHQGELRTELSCIGGKVTWI